MWLTRLIIEALFLVQWLVRLFDLIFWTNVVIACALLICSLVLKLGTQLACAQWSWRNMWLTVVLHFVNFWMHQRPLTGEIIANFSGNYSNAIYLAFIYDCWLIDTQIMLLMCLGMAFIVKRSMSRMAWDGAGLLAHCYSVYTLRVKKKQNTWFLLITSANVDRFSKLFTTSFSSNYEMYLSLKIPPHLKSVTTLPCETSVFRNWSN